jgi:hypothetical protein
MTKITGRILLILLLSTAAAALIWVVVEAATRTAGTERNNRAGAGHATREGKDHDRDSFRFSPDSSGIRVVGRQGTSHRGHDGERGFSPSRGLAGIIRSIVVISLITFTVHFIVGKRSGYGSRKPRIDFINQ